MNRDNSREIISKLIKNRLTPIEQDILLLSHSVTEKMREQWDTAQNGTKPEDIDGIRIWNNIRKETFEKIPARQIRLYQAIAWAASFLLLLSISGSLYLFFGKAQNPPYHTIHSGIRNISTVELPDGTNIQLGSGSKLTYPAEFTENTREIWLEGQAFVDVNPDKRKPFIVHTKQMDVEAIGTAFEIFAYAEDDFVETVLLNGKIKVNLENRKNSPFILMPNDKITYKKSENKVYHSHVNAESYTFWRTGVLSFENEKISTIIPRLEQWYGRKIFVEKEVGEAYTFTFKVHDESLEDILYIMSKSSPIHYEKSKEGDFTLLVNK